MNYVHHHELMAMEIMVPLLMMAYNLLHAFYARNLKPVVRKRRTPQHIGTGIQAEIYAVVSNPCAPP